MVFSYALVEDNRSSAPMTCQPLDLAWFKTQAQKKSKAALQKAAK